MSDIIFPYSGALPVGNYIYPSAGGSADYGILHDFYLIGGYQVLPTIAERNAIPITQPKPFMPYPVNFIDTTGFGSGRRKIGMIVYVQETDETYRLIPKGYFGNGGTGATGDSTAWLALDPWDKAVLLDPTINGVSNENVVDLTPEYEFVYEGVTGSGNPDDCWVKVSTETEVTYVEPAEVSANVYGGTASKGILEYNKNITYLVKFPTTNTGPITLSIDGFEFLDVKKVNANGLQPLVNGEINTDIVYPVYYDGTQFQIQVFETAPISVFGPTGQLLTAGLTGLNFTGVGVSASSVGGFVTVDISGGLGIENVYSQGYQIVGGTTGIPFATSFNFVDGPEDQTEYIDAYIDPAGPSGAGNVIVSVKTPGLQRSVIGIWETKTVSETSNIVTIVITRSLSGEPDKFVPSLVKVNYSYQNGSAIEGSDYNFVNGSVSFLPTTTGSLAFTFTVDDNNIQEGSRDFYINYSIDEAESTGKGIFSWGNGVTGATGSTLVTITDNDTASSYNFNFSPGSASQYEPKDGSVGALGTAYPVPVRFNLSASGTIPADEGGVTLNLLGTGTAVRGTDYVIYYNGSLDTTNSSWNLTFTSGNQPDIPVEIIPIRNPSRFDTNTTVNFNLSSPSASSNSQPSVVFPSTIGNPGTFTFTILEADISTISTFKFSNSSYGNVPEGATGQMEIQRIVSNLNSFSPGNQNVNYVQPANSTISLNFDPTSTAQKVTDFSTTWYVYNTSSGGSPVQTLNYSGGTNSNTIDFSSGEYSKFIRIGTVNDGAPSSTRNLKTNISSPSAIVNGINRGATGTPKDTSFNITDGSSWATSTFTVSASVTSINQPVNADTTMTLYINRSLSSSSGIIPDPISISYKVESTGGANGAVYGTHYSLSLPQEAVVNFDQSTNQYPIPVTIKADPLQIQEGNRSFKITIYTPAYQNPANPTNLAVLGSPSTLTVTINDTFVPPPYNRKFYYFHGGGGSNMPNQNDMVSPTAQYKLATGGFPYFYNTSDLSEVMTVLIEQGGINPAYKFQIDNFVLGYGVQISGSNATWTYDSYTSNDSYYIAVPKNQPPLDQYYSQDLTSPAGPYYLANAATNAPNFATGGKEFTYNGNVYKLYRLGEAPAQASITYKFI